MKINTKNLWRRDNPLCYLYIAYKAAKDRCTRQSNRNFLDYGGRGIQFNFKSLQEFVDELGERPSAEYSVDRINNDGNYESGNVRWATQIQQIHNQRLNKRYITNTTGFRGISFDKSRNKWQAQIWKLNKRYVLGRFDKKEDAARAYDKKASELYGEKADLNFSDRKESSEEQNYNMCDIRYSRKT